MLSARLSMVDQLQQVERNETAPLADENIQSIWPIEDTHYRMSSHSVVPQLWVKHPDLAFLVVKMYKKGESHSINGCSK